MFIEIEELKSAVYAYQLEQITEADDDIIYMAISSAEDEAKSYLRPNGRGTAPSYDVAAIFSATGTERHALLLELVKNMAVWYVIRLCNVDMIYEHVKDRYDRAIRWFKDVRSGELSPDLPVLAEADVPAENLVFRSGSRKKFNHE